MKNPTHRGDDDDKATRDEKASTPTHDDRGMPLDDKGNLRQGTYGGGSTPPATGVAGRAGAAPQTAPDPYKTYTLADFANEFTANLPADAAGGDYVAKEGDPWSDPAAHPWAVEGVHDARGWRFTFKDGKFVEAHRFASDEAGTPAGASARR